MGEKKTVLITGGTRGIGKETAKIYAKKGYNLVLNYVSDKTNVEEIRKQMPELGSEVLIVKADVFIL